MSNYSGDIKYLQRQIDTLRNSMSIPDNDIELANGLHSNLVSMYRKDYKINYPKRIETDYGIMLIYNEYLYSIAYEQIYKINLSTGSETVRDISNGGAINDIYDDGYNLTLTETQEVYVYNRTKIHKFNCDTLALTSVPTTGITLSNVSRFVYSNKNLYAIYDNMNAIYKLDNNSWTKLNFDKNNMNDPTYEIDQLKDMTLLDAVYFDSEDQMYILYYDDYYLYKVKVVDSNNVKRLIIESKFPKIKNMYLEGVGLGNIVTDGDDMTIKKYVLINLNKNAYIVDNALSTNSSYYFSLNNSINLIEARYREGSDDYIYENLRYYEYDWDGLTGGTGSNANVTIVDDLITGGSDSALSAEQGKVLNSMITNILNNNRRPNLEVADNSILIKTTSSSVSINGSSQTVTAGELLHSISGVTTLDISGNKIDEIYFGNNSTLNKLLIYNNNLNFINLERVTSIQYVHIHDNPICDNAVEMSNMISTLPDRNNTALGSIVTSNQEVRKEIELEAIDKEWYFGSMLQYNSTEKNKMGYQILRSGVLDIWESAEYGDGAILCQCDAGVQQGLTNLTYSNIISTYRCDGEENVEGAWNCPLAEDVPNSVKQKYHGNIGITSILGNGKNMYGIAPKAKAYILRCSDSNMNIDYEFANNMLDFIKEHADMIDIVVFPNSYPGGAHSKELCIKEQEVINTSIYSENGILFVGATGNDGDTVKTINDSFTFASVYGSLAVGGINDANDNIVYYAPYRKSMDVSFYGKSIKGENVSGGFTTMSGTSLSSDLMSGCALLIEVLLTKKLKRKPTYLELYDFILKHTKGIGNGNKYRIGNGLFNFMVYNNNVLKVPKINGLKWEE